MAVTQRAAQQQGWAWIAIPGEVDSAVQAHRYAYNIAGQSPQHYTAEPLFGAGWDAFGLFKASLLDHAMAWLTCLRAWTFLFLPS